MSSFPALSSRKAIVVKVLSFWGQCTCQFGVKKGVQLLPVHDYRGQYPNVPGNGLFAVSCPAESDIMSCRVHTN
jgi:hypothetical protein